MFPLERVITKQQQADQLPEVKEEDEEFGQPCGGVLMMPFAKAIAVLKTLPVLPICAVKFIHPHPKHLL
jgi:hypothetical protein